MVLLKTLLLKPSFQGRLPVCWLGTLEQDAELTALVFRAGFPAVCKAPRKDKHVTEEACRGSSRPSLCAEDWRLLVTPFLFEFLTS